LCVCTGGAGDLKKALAARTGLHPADQQVTYKGRERGNSEYLDACGVKNKSKLVVSEDPASLERRYIERQRAARIEAANRAIGAVALEVDKLADQVYIHPPLTITHQTSSPQLAVTVSSLFRADIIG
jgi:hypothetical protein